MRRDTKSTEKDDKQLLVDRESTLQQSGFFGDAGPQTPYWKLVGYVCAVISVSSDAASLCCSQALGGYVPAFQLSLLRFATQWAVVAPIILCMGWSCWPPKEHIPGIILLCLGYNLSNCAYYEASVYIPVGEALGLGVAVASVIIATLLYIWRRECRLNIALSVTLSVVGILLLVQPKFIFHHDQNLVTRPVCVRHGDLWSRPDDNQTAPTFSEKLMNISTVSVDNHDQNMTNKTSTHENLRYDSSSDSSLIKHPVRGYICALLTGIAFMIVTLVPSSLMPNSNPFVSIFWYSTSGVVVSAVVMFIMEKPGFPHNWQCILILVGHSFSACLTSILSQIVFLLLHPAVCAVLRSMGLVILAVAQYTVLKTINPGYGNTAEVAGLCVVLLSMIIGPLYQLYNDLSSSKMSKTQSDSERHSSDLENDCSN